MELGKRYVVKHASRINAGDGDVILSLQYKFKPTSVDMTKSAQLVVSTNDVEVTLKNLDGNDESFQGAAGKPSNEFVLGFAPDADSFTLSKINVCALNLRPVAHGHTDNMTSGENVERSRRTKKRLNELIKPAKKKRK